MQDDSKSGLWGGLHESVASLAEDGKEVLVQDPTLKRLEQLQKATSLPDIVAIMDFISDVERNRANSPLLDCIAPYYLEEKLRVMRQQKPNPLTLSVEQMEFMFKTKLMNPNDYSVEACRLGKKEHVHMLLAYGARIDPKVLLTAAEHGHKEVGELLLNRGLDPDFLNHNFIDNVIRLEKSGDKELVEFYWKQKFDVRGIYNIALKRAAKNGHKEVVALLLSRGADVHAEYNFAIRIASLEGHMELVELLLNHGANAHAHDDEAMRNAATRGHKEVVELLLNHGSNIHAREDQALRSAVDLGHKELVQMLLDRGADIHAREDQALRSAVDLGHKELVQMLLDRGANVSADYDEPMCLARERKDEEIMKMLLERGANPYARFSLQRDIQRLCYHE